LKLRPFESRDIQEVLAIQSACPEIAQWSARDYEQAAASGIAGWVAESARGIAGFLVARQIEGEAEILNFAVRQESRLRGVGTELLTKALDWSRSAGAERAFLEVRASNEAAIQFYERQGFTPAGRRRRYYTAPAEDALVLSFALKRAEG